MVVEENKQIVHGFIQRLFRLRDVEVLDEMEAADAVTHPMPSGASLADCASVKHALHQLFTAFPDLHLSICDLIAENDKVVLRGTLEGTQAGEYRGILPTGKHFRIPTIHVVQLRDGKIAEHWFTHDSLAVVQQLGSSVAA